MKNIDSNNHVRGKSIFVDDIAVRHGTLYASVFTSPVAHGRIKHINLSLANKIDGVVSILTYKDIPGENQIGAIIQDEVLLAEDIVDFIGQPIAVVIAIDEKTAFKAKSLIEVEIDELEIVTDVVDAFEKKQFIQQPRTFNLGDTKSAWGKCNHIFEGTVKSGGQEHLYLETQGSYAIPLENGNIKVYSSTQGPTAVQKIGAKVLGLPMHKIEVDVTRLGGAFGGKEDQATPWAIISMLGVYHLNKPVKLVLSRHDDMFMTGKRHPYQTNYKIGFDTDLKIVAFEADYLQNAGAAADLSPAITERTLFHITNSYFIPNVRATVYSCRTNLPPNTAFRGFGAPQSIFVIESALKYASKKLNVPCRKIQHLNLIAENDVFPYGQIAENVELNNIWDSANDNFDFDKTEDEVKIFNNLNNRFKKGISFTPVTFGISFTNTMMNHARALVHIYQDGSVGVSTGGVEMGQSLNTKIIQVAANVFSIKANKIKVESTNTTRVANTSPSAASSTADLNGKATELACTVLLERLKLVAANMLKTDYNNIEIINEVVYLNRKPTDLLWSNIVWEAFTQRVSLTENGHYATPEINFNKITEKGHPFAYHVYGLAITAVTVDCLRGTHEVDFVKIVHDFGKSINQEIDNGQIEGALVQGIGWMTMEEIVYSKEGKLLSNALSTYKVPDIFSAPANIEIIPLLNGGEKNAILKSKAVGEPPFNYGMGVYFALQDAINAFNPDYELTFDSPMTPEKTLINLYSRPK